MKEDFQKGSIFLMKEKILKPPKKAPRTLINPPISNSAIERIIP